MVLVGELSGHRVALFVDHENVFIGLSEITRGLPPDQAAAARRRVDPSYLAAALRSEAEKIGWVKTALAVADWERLPPGQVKEFLKQRFQIDYNLPGRNNADLKLVDAIRNVLEDPNHDDVDTYVLVTGDGGYMTIVDTLLRRQKMVHIWGVRSATSTLLQQSATGFQWVEDFLGIDLSSVESVPAFDDGVADGQGSPVVGNQVTRLEALTVLLDDYLLARDWQFITFVRLMGFLDESGVFGDTREEQLAWLSHAKETGILLEAVIDDPNSPARIARRFRLDQHHPLVARALGIRDRVIEMLPSGPRGVAFGTIINRLIANPVIPVSEVQAKSWLSWLSEVGYLVAEQVPHHKKDGVTVTLVRLNPAQLTGATQPAFDTDDTRLAEEADRAILKLANFLQRHPHFGWMALSQLLNRICEPRTDGGSVSPLLSREDAKRALAYAQERGDLTIEVIANTKTGGTTTVGRLNTDSPRVAHLMTWRDSVIRKLAELLVNRPGVNRSAFQTIVTSMDGLSPDDVGSMIDLLIEEGLIQSEVDRVRGTAVVCVNQNDLLVSKALLCREATPATPLPLQGPPVLPSY